MKYVSSITTTAAKQRLTGITNPSSVTLATATTTSSTIVNTLAAAAIPNTTSPRTSPPSSLTAPVQFKSVGRGRGRKPRQPPQ